MDSVEHNAWVATLAQNLEEEPGYHVIFDQFDLHAGKDLTSFMEDGLRADKIVVVVTPDYVRKADERRGGVGYESSIISAELLAKSASTRIIPVLRWGDERPSFLKSKIYVDFRPPRGFREALLELRRAIEERTPVWRPAKATVTQESTVTIPALTMGDVRGVSFGAAFGTEGAHRRHNFSVFSVGDNLEYEFIFSDFIAAMIASDGRLHIELSYEDLSVLAIGSLIARGRRTRIGQLVRRHLAPHTKPLALRLDNAFVRYTERSGGDARTATTVAFDGREVTRRGVTIPEVARGHIASVSFSFIVGPAASR